MRQKKKTYMDKFCPLGFIHIGCPCCDTEKNQQDPDSKQKK